MIEVTLVEDHNIIRQGIKMLLQPEKEIEVVAEAANGQELLDLLAAGQTAKVVLMDINMPVMDGVEASKYLQANYPDLKILAFSMHEGPEEVRQMLEAGASGYISKTAKSLHLIHAIKVVAMGNKFISPEISLNILNLKSVPNKEIGALPASERLTEREIAVLKLIAEGLTNQQIADKLFNSKRTIETHRQNIIAKTKCKNTAALIKYAIQNKVIEA